jgi:DNA polymerase III alpha subunit
MAQRACARRQLRGSRGRRLSRRWFRRRRSRQFDKGDRDGANRLLNIIHSLVDTSHRSQTWDDDRFAVQLGMRMVKGLANVEAGKILAGRSDFPFRDIGDVWRRSGAPAVSLVRLAEADAFQPRRTLQTMATAACAKMETP